MQPDECVLKVRSYEEMFRRNNILGNHTTRDSDTISESTFTIFCDGSWCKHTKREGLAATARTERIIIACRIGSLLEAEMQGVMAGMKIAYELNLQEVDIRGVNYR